MALSLGGSSRVDIHVDNPHGDDDRTFPPEPTTASQKGALQCLSLSQVQNHQRDVPLTQHKGLRVGVNRKATSEAFRDASDHFTKVQPSSQSDKNHRNRRTSRRVLHPLETVPENKSPEFSVTDTESKTTQHYLELSARQFPQHPILAAAGRIPSADIQHQKHQSGDFEWVLVINQPPVQATAGPRVDSGAARKLYLGCNLYPQAQGPGSGNASSELDTGLVLLLVTPLEGDYEDLERACTDFARTPQIMAVSKKTDKSSTLSTNQQSNQSTAPPRFVITVSDTEESQAQDSLVGGSETDSVARIEDSFEALDKLEDQLEAFDEAAHFKRVTIAEPPSGKSTDLAPSTPSARPNLPFKHGSASVRVKPVSRPGQSTLRKSLSMVFDSSKVKKEEKPSVQLPSRPSRTRAPGFVPPKPPVKSTKPLTIPSFELPGEATARRLKEQREARIAAQSAAEEAAKANARGGTLRRSKSARLTELPTFELPGEAISRRKREELNRQLKAQEEEERKRREFKARPIGAACAVAFIPRDTLASRARQQNKVATSENESLRFPPQNNSKRNSTDAHMLSRGPLEAASNLGTPRGRPLLGESRPTVRAASHASSNGSLGQSSSVSAEDMQQQRRKGEDIYRGDSFFAKDKELEKRGREQAAKVARAEAAEWSRLQSREWAIKQARKRTTIGSLRDLQV